MRSKEERRSLHRTDRKLKRTNAPGDVSANRAGNTEFIDTGNANSAAYKTVRVDGQQFYIKLSTTKD